MSECANTGSLQEDGLANLQRLATDTVYDSQCALSPDYTYHKTNHMPDTLMSNIGESITLEDERNFDQNVPDRLLSLYRKVAWLFVPSTEHFPIPPVARYDRITEESLAECKSLIKGAIRHYGHTDPQIVIDKDSLISFYFDTLFRPVNAILERV